MTAQEAIWTAARQHVFLFSGFTVFSALLVIGQAAWGREEARWMALMTSVWVVIHAGIAWWLLRHIHLPSDELLPHVFSHITRYMWWNVGADGLYAVVGLFLLSRHGQHRVMLRGFGKGVLLQGAGLAVMDVLFLARVIALHKGYLAG